MAVDGDYLRRVVDTVPQMLAYWDRDLVCRYANRAYETWFGVAPDRLVGTSLRVLLGPDLYALNEPLARGALAGKVQTFERTMPGPGGILRKSLASYVPDLRDGQVMGFVVSVSEVTALKDSEARLQGTVASLQAEIDRRHQAEDHLDAAQQNLAMTLASMDAGFIAVDRAGRVTRMNSVSERVTGWQESEAQGQALWDVFQREGRSAGWLAGNPVDLALEQQVQIGNAHDLTAIARDGTRRPVELKAAVTHARDGTVRGLALVLRDRSAEHDVTLAQNRLAAIVESSNDAIVSKTLAGTITSWNVAAERLFGYSADEAIGRSVQMLIPADRQHEEMAIVASLARGVRVPPFDTLRLAKDGRAIEVSITISPIRDAEGRIAGASKVVRDVTQARMAARLEAENRQIQEASRLKSQFLANMSHELRTPLNAIIGFAELLQGGAIPVDSPKRPVFLGHISTSGRQLLQLINDVLDLARVESGKFEFFPRPIDLPRLLADVTTMLQPAIAAKRIQLRIEIDPSLGPIELDAQRLKQVFYNYLSNAIKFSHDDGIVTVRADPEADDRWRLEVEDHGVGIPAAAEGRLFVEFEQLSAGHGKLHPGAGLGLALTRRLVEAQGGSVGVRSVEGQGSVFHAVLDRVQAGSARPGRPEPSVSPASTASTSPPPARLLVVEDDPAIQAHMRDTLSTAGFEVSAAHSIEQASELAAGTPYDGLTLDMRLSDQRGLALLAEIRHSGPSRGAAVIGLTLSTSVDRTASFAIADIVAKPLHETDVVNALRRFGLGAGARVMVIDDEAPALALMREILAGAGIEAVGFQDGRTALTEIERHRPQAIVLDLMMPGYDGFEVLDALHRLPAWRETPVFIWTAMILDDDEYAQLARSAQAIVGKGGGDLSAMLERLRRWRPPTQAETPPRT